MPTREQIVTFDDESPLGSTGLVPGALPTGPGVELAESDPRWRSAYGELADRIRAALGWRVLLLQHVGSTSVPELLAKPVIDIDLIVADPTDEAAYVPALEHAGFELRRREPWWHEHRLLRAHEPRCLLHVFGPDSPEPWKHRLFRDWLSGNPDDRERYAAAKRAAAAAATAAGEDTLAYNARKQAVIREIYRRAFVAAGLLDG